MTMPLMACLTLPLTLPLKGKSEMLSAVGTWREMRKEALKCARKPVLGRQSGLRLLEARPSVRAAAGETGCRWRLGSSGLSLAWVPVLRGWLRALGGGSSSCGTSPQGVLLELT